MPPAQRPTWSANTLEMLRLVTHDLPALPPGARADVDQVSATLRDAFGEIGLDLDDEWTLLTAIQTVELLTSQVVAAHELGLICVDSMRILIAIIRGDLAMFAEYVPADRKADP